MRQRWKLRSDRTNLIRRQSLISDGWFCCLVDESLREKNLSDIAQITFEHPQFGQVGPLISFPVLLVGNSDFTVEIQSTEMVNPSLNPVPVM